MRYYRDTVFVPPPGPDSATARQIAARYGGGNGQLPGEETADGGAPGRPGAARQAGSE